METLSQIQSKFKKREWTFLILLSLGSWMQAVVFSLQGPFYPPEVFGIFVLLKIISVLHNFISK